MKLTYYDVFSRYAKQDGEILSFRLFLLNSYSEQPCYFISRCDKIKVSKTAEPFSTEPNYIKPEKRIKIDKIASFTIDHIKLQPGIYVSRKDTIGAEIITSFDLRMTSPNEEPVMNTAEMHTMEHLAATFLRNHPHFKDKTIYFGPMGCRTGFYLLLAGSYESAQILPLMIEMYEFIRDFHDQIPGASPKDCGNYLDMNLPMANLLAKGYLENVLYNIGEDRLTYPE